RCRNIGQIPEALGRFEGHVQPLELDLTTLEHSLNGEATLLVPIDQCRLLLLRHYAAKRTESLTNALVELLEDVILVALGRLPVALAALPAIPSQRERFECRPVSIRFELLERNVDVLELSAAR